MKKIRSLILATVLTGVPSMSLADHTLVVELKNGDTHEYTTQQHPVVTFTEEGVKISGTDGIAVYPETDFNRFFFKKTSGPITGLKDITVPHTCVNYQFLDNDNLIIKITPSMDIPVFVYDMTGRVINETRAVNGKARVNLSNLTSGIYILNTDNHSIKIIRK